MNKLLFLALLAMIGCISKSKHIVYKGLFKKDTVILLQKPVYVKAVEICVSGAWPDGSGYLAFKDADSMDLAHWKEAEHEVVVLTYYPETGKTDTGTFFMGDTIRLTSCEIPKPVPSLPISILTRK